MSSYYTLTIQYHHAQFRHPASYSSEFDRDVEVIEVVPVRPAS